MSMFHQVWSRRRRMGRLRFILIFGVLAGGLPASLGHTAADLMWMPIGNGKARSYAEIVSMIILFSLIGGIGFGWWLWASCEREYRRWLSQDEPENRTA